MAALSSISLTLDLSNALQDATRQLIKREVAIGIPDSGAERQPVPGEKNSPSNAVIGYVQEFGDDEKHIPARPFLLPGVEAAKPEIIAQLTKTGQAVLDIANGKGGSAVVNKGLTAVGFEGVKSVKAVIMAGNFAPLSARTIQARASRRNKETGKLTQNASSKAARKYLSLQAQGVPTDVLSDPGVGLATPLLDTRSMFGAIKFVVRDKGKD